MTTPTQFLRSKYRAIEGGCVTCAGDLAVVESLPGVKEVDALASGLVLVTHDGTVSDDAVVAALTNPNLLACVIRPGFTDRTRDEIDDLERQVEHEPFKRTAQRTLAADITTLVHGPDATAAVQAASQALFGSGDLTALDAAIGDDEHIAIHRDARGGARAARDGGSRRGADLVDDDCADETVRIGPAAAGDGARDDAA